MSKGGQPRIQKTPLAKCSQIPEIRILEICIIILFKCSLLFYIALLSMEDSVTTVYMIFHFHLFAFFLEIFMLISHSRHYKAGIENFFSAQIMVI